MENLAWIDLETTGLRPSEDAILEIALVITNQDLSELHAQDWVIKPSKNVPITEISETVAEMHQQSGLWIESLTSSIDIADAHDDILHLLDAYPKMIACGFGVHFDRGFLREQAPEINDALHYRNLDVRAFTAAMRMYKPAEFERTPKANRRHRALDDCRDAIAEFKYYREVLGL